MTKMFATYKLFDKDRALYIALHCKIECFTVLKYYFTNNVYLLIQDQRAQHCTRLDEVEKNGSRRETRGNVIRRSRTT